MLTDLSLRKRVLLIFAGLAAGVLGLVAFFYCLLLTVAIRFLHFSLFHGTFFLPPATLPTALHYAMIDFAVILAIAALGRTRTRAGQMARQYRFERA